VLKDGWTIHAYASEADREPALPFYDMMYRGIRLLPVLTFLTPRDEEDRALEDIARGMAAGTLTHHVGPRFGLDQIVAAHEAVENGVWGKVVVEV
jgi:NADPH2:quinone reductase